jgi:membrane-associated phospholipid phosphatase
LIGRARRHVRRLWPDGGAWLPLPIVLWPLGWILAGKGRGEHVVMLLLVLGLAYAAPWTKKLFVGLFPIGLLGVVYDAMRFVQNVGVTPGRVHDCDLRAIDMAIASVNVNGTPGSVHDWFQAHTSTALDLICAVPYGTFIYVALAFAVFLYLKDYQRLRAFGWTFLTLNVCGFITYHIYPAAPPWYFHTHGCAIDIAAHASEGPNLARVDAMLGVHYFAGFYGRASDVFGAMPSLHVAYPMLIVLYGWPLFRLPGRIFAGAFLVTMCFAAMYLDHHWIVDVLAGLTYTVIVFFAVRAIMRADARAARAQSAERPEGGAEERDAASAS